MTNRIIYKTPEGGVAIIVPAGSIEDCIKDVPSNTPYKIINTTDVPTDRTFRDAWEYQE